MPTVVMETRPEFTNIPEGPKYLSGKEFLGRTSQFVFVSNWGQYYYLIPGTSMIYFLETYSMRCLMDSLITCLNFVFLFYFVFAFL